MPGNCFMRALILSDIHANLEALNAVLAAAGEWDALWNLGDMVGYGASPNQVLDVIRPLATLTVRGNHDRVCSGLSSALAFNPTARAAAKWTLRRTQPGQPASGCARCPQGPLQPEHPRRTEPRVTLAHGSPLNEDQYIMTMRDAWAPLQQMTTAITFVGHTHIQGGFSQKEHDWHELRPRYQSRNDADTWTMPIPPGTRNLINPGSVGQPRDSRLARGLRHLRQRGPRDHLPPRALRPAPRPEPHPDGAPARAPAGATARRPLGRSHALLLLRAVLPLVGQIWFATIGSTHAKPNTRHEVTAARAGRPSGRTAGFPDYPRDLLLDSCIPDMYHSNRGGSLMVPVAATALGGGHVRRLPERWRRDPREGHRDPRFGD